MWQSSIQSAWLGLRQALKPGTEVRGRGKARGYSDLRFRIVDSDAGSIAIISPTISASRRFGRAEFEKLFDLWVGYCAGQVSRQEITAISQNSSYILAILRWYEDATERSQ